MQAVTSSRRPARAILLAALVGLAPHLATAQPFTLKHVHGLAFTPSGDSLLIPSHHGLAVYRAGGWSKAPGPEHDYMGFSVTKRYFYSSGHPAPGSGLVNPFGLIRSSNQGRSWEKLGLEGESDFHLLAAGWETNAVYVYNPGRNSRMAGPGLYSTLNQGFTWTRAAAKGLAGELLSLAAHPTRRDTLAAGTKRGLYLSDDGGKTFRALVRGEQILGLCFDLDGQQLWYSGHAGAAKLARIALKRGRSESLDLPPMKDDAVAYIAQNPADLKQMAIATFRRSVYLSRDAGQSWRAIAREGRGLEGD